MIKMVVVVPFKDASFNNASGWYLLAKTPARHAAANCMMPSMAKRHPISSALLGVKGDTYMPIGWTPYQRPYHTCA
jgi:hypothetical protein